VRPLQAEDDWSPEARLSVGGALLKKLVEVAKVGGGEEAAPSQL
jgi:hypothetical protein